MNLICKYCGKDTSDIEYDYLDGQNHLSCTLEYLTSKNMKIKGWDKINGFTYKGYCIINPMYNALETRYMADVINLNIPQKTKWELSLLTPEFKFMDTDFHIQLWAKNKLHTAKNVTKDEIKSIAGFRLIYEELVDELIELEKKMNMAKPVTGPTNFNMNISSSLIW